MKILIVFYSAYGHVYKMAEAVAEGAREVEGAEVILRRVPETLPEDLLKQIGAFDAAKAFEHIPICTIDELASAMQLYLELLPIWKHGWTNETISRRHRRLMGKRCTHWKSRQTFLQVLQHSMGVRSQQY